MSSPFFTFYIFHHFNYVSATKPRHLWADSTLAVGNILETVGKWHSRGGGEGGGVAGEVIAGWGPFVPRDIHLYIPDLSLCLFKI